MLQEVPRIRRCERNIRSRAGDGAVDFDFLCGFRGKGAVCGQGQCDAARQYDGSGAVHADGVESILRELCGREHASVRQAHRGDHVAVENDVADEIVGEIVLEGDAALDAVARSVALIQANTASEDERPAGGQRRGRALIDAIDGFSEHGTPQVCLLGFDLDGACALSLCVRRVVTLSGRAGRRAPRGVRMGIDVGDADVLQVGWSSPDSRCCRRTRSLWSRRAR